MFNCDNSTTCNANRSRQGGTGTPIRESGTLHSSQEAHCSLLHDQLNQGPFLMSKVMAGHENEREAGVWKSNSVIV